MDRIFVNELDGEFAIIDGDDYNHLVNVLRFQLGDKLEIAYNGKIYLANIIEIENKSLEIELLEELDINNEAKTKITLFQGIAKGNRMDYVFQKGTEIDISSFSVFTSERSIVKLNDRNKKTRKERWEKIIEAAGKQSFRNIIPKFNGFYEFEEMLEELNRFPLIIAPYESEEEKTLKEILKTERYGEIAIVIGPESGFESSEIEKMKNIGANIITLGPRILRTETAGPLTSGLILYEYGDME